ncbi:MAG: hypothetical protein U0263_17430 [Polyangiaceae bacterium]
MNLGHFWKSVAVFAIWLAWGCGGSTSGGDATGGTGNAGSGGTGANNAGGGTGGATGGTGGTVVPLIPATKIDLLLMVDNSISMADKQQVLGEALPALLQRFATPTPDPSTGAPPFKAIQDIHIGVISSSLGGHGADQCDLTLPSSNPTQNDRAHLMGTVRTKLDSYQGLGFLWWDPKGTAGGEGNIDALATAFTSHVLAAGEQGCGYEAQLESWYRFLIDPAPPLDVVMNNNVAELQGVDDVLLKQRADFLRPDSAVIIVMLTDENDCSIVDGGFNWIAAQTATPNNTAFHLPRGTSACATNPDSACCRSCASAEPPPSGCGEIAQDPECQKGSWDDAGDHPNLRCYRQKQRFGLSFLYPTARYVEALTSPMICPTWDGKGKAEGCALIPNPLLATRNPGLVFLAGIVGVPWEDLATADTLGSPTSLRYELASELATQGRWSWLLPSDGGDEPDDPLMIESVAPRSGTQPATKQTLASANAGAGANSTNGHEWNANGQLQFACIYRLDTPKDCSVLSGGGCDCDDAGPGYGSKNPLCQAPSTGTYSTTQYYAKAFPGTRPLEVLKGVGKQAIVASICPKIYTGDPSASAYGYNPMVDLALATVGPALAK